MQGLPKMEQGIAKLGASLKGYTVEYLSFYQGIKGRLQLLKDSTLI